MALLFSYPSPFFYLGTQPAKTDLSLYEVAVRFGLGSFLKGGSSVTLCRELEISRKTVEDIKDRRKPKSEGVGLKMLYELFPQMAV